MIWFCETCRINFDPAVYNREKIIMKALRELLIRTDSMDTRLGNYGENLRKINETLYNSHPSKSSNNSLHATFSQTIDQLTLDDIDPINRSRSCDETSFMEVLDEVNSSLAQPMDKFVVGNNKKVMILDKPSAISASTTNAHRTNVSTPAASARTNRPATSRSNMISASPEQIEGATGPRQHALKVANNNQPSNDVESFYVTPFAPDQSEDEVKMYVADISNAHPSLIKVTKLIPRGRSLNDLSFVSFKVTICRSYSREVGDAFYWPEGITVRVFDVNQKNGSAVRIPNSL